MSNVAKLPNAAIAGEVDAVVVEMLETYLEQAKRGEIVAFMACAVRPNGDTVNNWHSASGKGHQLSTGLLILQHDYARAWIAT